MQKIYVLVGLPGSGKSTYAKKLEEQGIVRVNQDILGSRKKCMQVAKSALALGKSVCIDRCNPSVSQRKHWIDLAEDFNVRVEAHVFTTPKDVCIARAKARTDHENLKDPVTIHFVISMFSVDYKEPSLVEGFQSIEMISNV